MSWRFEWFLQGGRKYGRYKQNYRKKDKVQSNYVYLGNEETATRIRSDFTQQNASTNTLYTYSGEILLREVARLLKFSRILNRKDYGKVEWNVGDFFETVVIERCLNPFSKWNLAQKTHKRSVLSFLSDIPASAFSEDNIYNYMDYIHPYIHQIQSELVDQVHRLFPSDNETLILDGTSYYAHKADTDPFHEDEEVEEDLDLDEETIPDLMDNVNLKPISRRHGYSRDKKPDLPQINVMLGVNQRSIPLYFEVFAGNTSDLGMFKTTLSRLHTTYKGLLKRMKRKYIIFDRGNLNPKNVRWLEQLCEEWGLFFVGGVKSSLLKKQLSLLRVEELPVIFSQDSTQLYGRTIQTEIYNRPYNVLLYVSRAVRDHKLAQFQNRLEEVLELLNEVGTDSKLSDVEKIQKMKTLLRKKSMVQLFQFQKFDNGENSELPPGATDSLYLLRSSQVEAKKAKLAERSQSTDQFLTKLNRVSSLLAAINDSDQLSPPEKVQQMKSVLKKHSMVRLFWLQQFSAGGSPDQTTGLQDGLYQLIEAKVEERKSLLGKFALVSNDFQLTAKELMRMYKTKEVVEHEFHILKGLLKIRPLFHRLPNRIESHNAIVHWGMLLLSVLRCQLEDEGFFFSFEELRDFITHGYIQKSVYLYPGHKNYLLTHSTNISAELEQIFNLFQVKPQPFHIEYLPTES